MSLPTEAERDAIRMRWQHRLVDKDPADILNALEAVDDAIRLGKEASIINDKASPFWAQELIVDLMRLDDLHSELVILNQLERTFNY